MAKKHVDDITMTFNTEETKTEPITTPAETYEKDGHIIYKKDEKGFMQFFDADNNPISSDEIEKLSSAYPQIEDTNAHGDEKEGELQTRYVKQEPTASGVKNSESDLENCDIIEHRQYYKNGEAVIQTIPKRFYYILKYLRGEYD